MGNPSRLVPELLMVLSERPVSDGSKIIHDYFSTVVFTFCMGSTVVLVRQVMLLALLSTANYDFCAYVAVRFIRL